MAVPKRRVCHGRKKRRQSHQALCAPPMALDRSTKSVHRPHHVDLKTGIYGGRQVLFKDQEKDGGKGAEAKPEGGEQK